MSDNRITAEAAQALAVGYAPTLDDLYKKRLHDIYFIIKCAAKKGKREIKVRIKDNHLARVVAQLTEDAYEVEQYPAVAGSELINIIVKW
jgi:hypothetical protein